MIRIVIVEDDLMVSALNAQFAEQTPSIHVVATFHDGKRALEYLQEHKADLLLLDLFMPEMSGLELLKALREQNDHVGAILITAANDSGTIEKALHLGIIDYLVKPVETERLAQALARVRENVALHMQAQKSERISVEKGGKKILIAID